MEVGDARQARHRDRRPRAEREVQRGEGRDPAAVLHAVPAGRAHRRDRRSTCAPRSIPRRSSRRSRASIARTRPEPAGREPARRCRSRCGRTCSSIASISTLSAAFAGAGDAAGGRRPLRRARVHGGAAHARDRPAHGARRRRRRGALDGAAPGRVDDADRRRHRPRRSRSASASAPSRCSSRSKGYDPVVLSATGALLAVVAFAAGFIPAVRASRVDPMTALRYE